MLHGILSIPLFIAATCAQTVNIGVGQNGNVFTPSSVNATVGTTVVFTWSAGTHNVIQTIDNSCTNITTGGFTSGPAANQPGKTFNFTITKPGNIWYTCQIHCATGMKGVIFVGNGTATPSPTATSSPPTSTGISYPTPTVNGADGISLAIWLTSVGMLVNLVF